MPLHILDNKLWFPPVEDAMEDGLLAMGGEVSADRLLLAYSKGIFPWYDGYPPLWWCPNPRFILFPDELKVSKSMKLLLGKEVFRFTTNQAFAKVIKACKEKPRRGQDGTWITNEVEAAYIQLHHLGHAHSAEVWLHDQLAGGLYGVQMGNIFFGESMFSNVSNASKYAFIKLVEQLRSNDIKIIDCQVHTTHLESLGAKMISRNEFMEFVNKSSF